LAIFEFKNFSKYTASLTYWPTHSSLFVRFSPKLFFFFFNSWRFRLKQKRVYVFLRWGTHVQQCAPIAKNNFFFLLSSFTKETEKSENFDSIWTQITQHWQHYWNTTVIYEKKGVSAREKEKDFLGRHPQGVETRLILLQPFHDGRSPEG